MIPRKAPPTDCPRYPTEEARDTKGLGCGQRSEADGRRSGLLCSLDRDTGACPFFRSRSWSFAVHDPSPQGCSPCPSMQGMFLHLE
ncbi:unnamed protein product [Gulo gulo]|uniref:Uncharacterized protein n=1 Tax=Gulo gulo TaxID=48420 RepID=A0A9X9PYT1_GULGU|nr:unnamed protein product [Gulo gulo]